MVEYDNLELWDEFINFLPRNLSYTEVGYLDNFNTCSQYVRTKSAPPSPKCPSCSFQGRVKRNKTKEHLKMTDPGSPCHSKMTLEVNDVTDGIGSIPDADNTKGDINEVPSEEGVFVNMMDDLDSIESPHSRDSTNSDPSYFSLDSPDEASDVDEPALQALSKMVTKKLEKTKPARPSLSCDLTEELPDLRKTQSDGNLETKFASLKVDTGSGGSLCELEARNYLLRVPDSPVYDEPEFQVDKSQLRKSSSLKTNKTPPGTPHRKKMVRFADAMGLDLENVRHVMDTQNPPRIPASAIADLRVGVESDRRDVGSRFLDLCFSQPGAMDGFLDKVMGNKVSLENCVITGLSITGIVRVANIGYHKIVRVRYSINNWVTFYDVMASYVQNSCDGPTDRFSFTIVTPALFGPGARLLFAVSYTCSDMVYWDSNNGRNYEVVCYAKTTPNELEASWMHFV